MNRAVRRPSPDELLRRAQAGERDARRGRLKVFLGYASHVGKSFRMFDEGRRRKERGQDVVVGAVQGKVTTELREVLSRLEAIPTTGDAIDIPALLQRRPSVCLIDGLAFDNPPGSRHTARWQDVEELLQRGIGVITAVNVQHIREQQDEVQRITGKRAAYSVPQAFLAEADEVEVVDAPPDALPELREMALLLAADVVDHQLQRYLDAHGISARGVAQERILVCLTARSSAGDMLRSGQRNASRFHGALLVAYVEQPELQPEDRARLDAHLQQARELGAEVQCLHGDDFVDAILEFAHEQRITQLFLGHSGRERRVGLARNPVDRLIDAAEDFDVRLFPQRERV